MKPALFEEDGAARSLLVVSTGLANVGSVVNMCSRLGADVTVSDDTAEVRRAHRLLLPGVGAFDLGMETLARNGLDRALVEVAGSGRPILGICLGMQLLLDRSEEGDRCGLGLVPGVVRRLASESHHGRVRIPHMGWSRVREEGGHPLFDGMDEASRYYFVHSYAADPDDPTDVSGRSTHGAPFVSAVARRNVMGVQFHPEKSHRYGKALLGNFLRMDPCL